MSFFMLVWDLGASRDFEYIRRALCVWVFCSNPVFVDFTLLTFNQHMNWFSWKKAGFETVSCPRCEQNTIQVLFITFPSPSLPPSAQFFSFPSCYLRIVTASSCPDGRCTMMPSLCSPMAELHGAVKKPGLQEMNLHPDGAVRLQPSRCAAGIFLQRS